MNSLNKVILIGRLTRDPELRYTPGNGVAVCNFGLAVERPFTNRQGERDVDFINIVTWRKQAELCANNLGKGRRVAIDGRLQIRSYENREGQKRTVAEVVGEYITFLDWPRSRGGGEGSEGDNNSSSGNPGNDFGFGNDEYEVQEDDVPF